MRIPARTPGLRDWNKNMTDNEKAFLATYDIHDYNVPLATVDMSIFAVIDNRLHVLLVKRTEHPNKGHLALPGGFIDFKKDQCLEDAAHRKLTEKTGVKSPYLEQVGTVGSPNRDIRGWSLTVLYFALIDYQRVTLDDDSSQWIAVEDANQLDLAFDHKQLLQESLDRLRSRTRYTALPLALMPKDFTLTELQKVFEVILGRSLQLKSFRKRLLDADILIGTDRSKIAGKRPAQLYNSKGVSREFEFPRPLEI